MRTISPEVEHMLNTRPLRSASRDGSTAVTRAKANGGRGPTEKATSSPTRGRRLLRGRTVSHFSPRRMGLTNSPLNHRVFTLLLPVRSRSSAPDHLILGPGRGASSGLDPHGCWTYGRTFASVAAERSEA